MAKSTQICVRTHVTGEILREIETVSDTEGRYILDLARVYVQD